MKIQSKINNHLSLIIWFGVLYNCRDTFTYVMSALQINLFLQNEPNFRKSQVNVSDLVIREYEQMDTWSIRKIEPKTNPNEPKTNPILANKTPIRTQNKPNSNPISEAKTSGFYGYILAKEQYNRSSIESML
jgi:hypothetical protein